MPLYEYFCPKCEHEFELLIRGSEIPVCPDCGNKNLTREMSTPAAHTKSSEFGCKPSGQLRSRTRMYVLQTSRLKKLRRLCGFYYHRKRNVRELPKTSFSPNFFVTIQ
ncbi:MAG: zinc ribbon domain-containing protein [Planctomycetaceae bacterium]|jgi:putative FmdB family regulatory protein|nr:zinc ribbon domain-containing protein [Planctomycetaceae bacterium]